MRLRNKDALPGACPKLSPSICSEPSHDNGPILEKEHSDPHTPDMPASPQLSSLFVGMNRFMQLVPQYYFSNLPPSESKDILQQASSHLPTTAVKKDQDGCDKCPDAAEQRCSIQ